MLSEEMALTTMHMSDPSNLLSVGANLDYNAAASTHCELCPITMQMLIAERPIEMASAA